MRRFTTLRGRGRAAGLRRLGVVAVATVLTSALPWALSLPPLSAQETPAIVLGPDLVLELPASRFPTSPRPVVVPFEMLPSNHMVIEARLNGEGPFNLIFDLGSPIVLLSNRAAERVGALPDDAPRSFLFGARGEGQVTLFQAGPLTAYNVPVVVMDHPAVKALGEALRKPLDGIVGYTLFARYRTTLDYQKKEMTFVPLAGIGPVSNLVAELPDRMLGPKVQRTRILAPTALFGLDVADSGADAEPGSGVAITEVHANGPGAAAGFRVGDQILAIDGRWTTHRDDVYTAATACHPHRPVTVEILREGRPLSIRVTPVEGL